MVNKVLLIGRLGKDPEVRFTSGGQSVANFSLATDESYKDKEGNKQKRTTWHQVCVWGKQAEIAQKFLRKGSLIYLEGRLSNREWEKNGTKQRATEIVADNFRMLEKSPNAPAEAGHAPEISAEDIPF